jgi:hypothetical protein
MERNELLSKVSDELDVTIDAVLDYFGSFHWSTALDEGVDPDDYDTVLACLEQFYFG